MKRLIILIVAALALSAVSCSEKQDAGSPLDDTVWVAAYGYSTEKVFVLEFFPEGRAQMSLQNNAGGVLSQGVCKGGYSVSGTNVTFDSFVYYTSYFVTAGVYTDRMTLQSATIDGNVMTVSGIGLADLPTTIIFTKR